MSSRQQQAAKLSSGLGPGQWVEPPAPRRRLSLEERAWRAINRGQKIPAVTDELAYPAGELEPAARRAMIAILRERIDDLQKLLEALEAQQQRVTEEAVREREHPLPVTPKLCAMCDQPVIGRPDARYCSNACRQRAYRQRNNPQT